MGTVEVSQEEIDFDLPADSEARSGKPLNIPQQEQSQAGDGEPEQQDVSMATAAL